jgi:hypothetical protein
MRRRRVARVAVGTAVVAGTAGAVHHHQNKKYAQQDYEQQQANEQQQPAEEEYYPEEQQAAPAAGPDLTVQLQQLGQLHDSGVLSDEEFAAAKQKLLSS